MHQIPISPKPSTHRTATAEARIRFSNPSPVALIQSAALRKGDVLAVSRVAGIMAAKRTSELVPLCHAITLEGVEVDLKVVEPETPVLPSNDHDNNHINDEEDPPPTDAYRSFGSIDITATVQTTAKTGVEMEALTAVVAAGLSVIDMCKSVDRGMSMDAVRVREKSGGRSGTWRDGKPVEAVEED